MERQQAIAYFISFCIEQYKVTKGLTGENTVILFNKYHVMEYLYDCYEVLHTQGHRWLLEEIDEFIDLRQKEEYA